MGLVERQKTKRRGKKKSPKTAPWPVSACLSLRSRQAEPPQTSLSKVLSLAPDYRREMHIPAPRSRSRDTPVPAVTALALAAAVPPSLFLSGAVECPLSTAAVLYDSASPYKVVVRVARSGCVSDTPVQPDYHAHSGNNLLRPIRNRHDNSPVAVAIGNWER